MSGVLVGLESRRFGRGRHKCPNRGCAGERRMVRRTRRAAELQAQVAMRRGMLGEREIVVRPVSDISRGREQQRHEREQRYEAVVAKAAYGGERGHGRKGWPGN